MKFFFAILFIVGSNSIYCQDKFLFTIDTNYSENNYLKDSVNPIEFINDSRLNEEFNPLNVDIDLLNAGLYSAIQSERKRKARQILTFSLQQYTLCIKFLDFYLPNKFVHEEESLEKFTKTTKKALKKVKFPLGISKTITFKVRALDFKGQNFYYLRKDASSELKLFKGTKPTITDSIELNELKKEPVPTFTYKKFIYYFMRNYLKKKYNTLLYSKDYSSMGVAVKVDKRTLNCNRIPEVAVILIFGANRLKNIDQAVAKSKK